MSADDDRTAAGQQSVEEKCSGYREIERAG
jgi:hypothetical protein